MRLNLAASACTKRDGAGKIHTRASFDVWRECVDSRMMDRRRVVESQWRVIIRLFLYGGGGGGGDPVRALCDYTMGIFNASARLFVVR